PLLLQQFVQLVLAGGVVQAVIAQFFLDGAELSLQFFHALLGGLLLLADGGKTLTLFGFQAFLFFAIDRRRGRGAVAGWRWAAGWRRAARLRSRFALIHILMVVIQITIEFLHPPVIDQPV